MDTHSAILTTTDDSLITEADASHGTSVTDQGSLVLASAWVPDLDRLVLCTTYDTK